MAKRLVDGTSSGVGSIGKSKSDTYVFEEVIPGLGIKNAPRVKKTSKEPITLPAPSTPSPTEVNYSTFKSVNPVTQYLYTRYRNAKKRLARIENHEKNKEENPDYSNDAESQLLARKADDLATVNEIQKILPQIAEMSQELILRSDEEKEKAEKNFKKELETACLKEREACQKTLDKTLELFSSLLTISQDPTYKLDAQTKNAFEELTKTFVSKPFDESKRSALLEHVNQFVAASDKSITSDGFTYNDLDSSVKEIMTHAPVPLSQPSNKIEGPEISECDPSTQDGECNTSTSVTSNDEFISEDDFDSPNILVFPYTVVPPGGIYFLNPSEIFPGEPRGLFKSPSFEPNYEI